MLTPPSEAFFLAAPGGQRYCIFHPPCGVARGAVLQVHAFAEEINKSRRMCALQSRSFAEAGFAVLQIDLLGCGDSSGDFGDASWASWLADLSLAADCLHARCPAPLTLWGQRAGCLLAAAVAPSLGVPSALLCWQPPASGKLLLQQFLRLKAAGAMMDGEGKGISERLRLELAAGQPVEVSGYTLSPALAQGLEAATFVPWPGMRSAAWLETSMREDASLLPATAGALQRWQAAGAQVQIETVAGPAFWQTAEIEIAPALIAASTATLMRMVS